MEEGANELKQMDKEKALVKLNDLARQLAVRKKQLGGNGESLKRQMEQIGGIDKGPAEMLAKALAKGDFQKAANELEQLKKQLDDKKLDPAKKDELAKQMEQLKQKIQQMAQQAKDAQADLQKRADQLRQPGGNPAAAEKLEEQIQRLQQQVPQMDALNSLCNKLGQCANQMKQGNGAQACQSMQEAMQQLQQMAQQQREMKTLDGAMQMLDNARRQMTCDKCGGKGCKECQGEAESELMAMSDDSEGNKDGKPGPNPGTRPGEGSRPEAKADGRFYDSRVAQKVGKGAGMVARLTDGPNLKNQAEAEIQQAAAAIEHGSTNPLSGQQLPRKLREHAEDYFNKFREGK